MVGENFMKESIMPVRIVISDKVVNSGNILINKPSQPPLRSGEEADDGCIIIKKGG